MRKWNPLIGWAIQLYGVGVQEMPSGDEYRSRANECIAAADKVSEPERKVSLLELAQRWLRLAFQVEKIGERNGVRGDVLLDDDQGQRNH